MYGKAALGFGAVQNEIGDDAFHQIEEELDWLEMAHNKKEESEPAK